MNVTALKKEKGDPRTELRRAITEAQDAVAAVDRLRVGVERAQNLSMAGRIKLEAATKAVTAAKAKDAEALASAIAGGDVAPPQATTPRARELEVAATDTVEAMRSAIVRLEADLKHAEREAERAGKVVNVAVAAVLAPVAKRMSEEARHFRSEFLVRMHATDAMCVSGLDGIARLRFDVGEQEHRALCASVRQPWLDTIKALNTDSEAPVPDLAGGLSGARG